MGKEAREVEFYVSDYPQKFDDLGINKNQLISDWSGVNINLSGRLVGS